MSKGFALFTTAAALGLAFAPARVRASGGEQLWRFYADFAVTVVEPIADLSGNGGKDVLVGSQDDSLYLVEGKGVDQGKQLWQVGFQSTLSAAASIGDVDGDGRADVVGGDEAGYAQCISGGTGLPIWRHLFPTGTILSIISIPDVDGDNKPEAVLGSEDDSVYCMSSKGHGSGQILWTFGLPAASGHPGPGTTTGHPKVAIGGRPGTGTASGANSLALLHHGAAALGIALGTNTDTVYCLPLAGGAPLWKTGLPGDVWKVTAFPDQDGDGIEEVLLACGADAGYLLSGKDGKILWSHAVSLGAVSVEASPDATGDGKADALIGDGGGHVHCVAGNAAVNGGAVPAAWTFDFGDTSTILSIAALGDLDGDSRSECAVGTSNDVAAVVTGKGAKGWSVNMAGDVNMVGNLGDIDGNGAVDVVAGTETGFASAFSGAGAVALGARGPAQNLCLMRCLPSGQGGAGQVTWEIRLNRPARALLEVFDGSGRKLAAPFQGYLPAGARRIGWNGAGAAGAYAARLSVDGTPVATSKVAVDR